MRLELMIRTFSTARLLLFLALLPWVVGRDDSPGFTGNLYQARAIVDQDGLPTKAPVVGIGYQTAPD
jgi:hypothetical protein